jgi:anti-sigma regulatory factor (Ser/Thr protein kinase)
VAQVAQGFAATVAEVGAARRFAGAAVVAWDVVADDVVLLVGELAANAVCHAGSDFEVSVEQVGGAVLVEVTDASPIPPRMASLLTHAVGGRGLLIVDRLARAWGFRPTAEGGKTVWAELPTA